ncbi:MAG: hypothetical protein QF464_07710, partial [Myxococcota bacterium]|nr:hypothetical protein [Myxococcota bacterium]
RGEAAACKKAKSKKLLALVPKDYDTLASIQNRYQDLIDKLVRVRGVQVSAATYYNCRFRSRKKWRAVKLQDGSGGYRSMTGYCKRGTDNCDSVVERIADGGRSVHDVTLRYKKNRICAEGQIEVLWFGDN